MTVETFPSILPQRAQFGLVSRTQSFQSKLTSATQTLRMAGAFWAGRISFDNLDVSEVRQIQAFFVKLEGMNGRFYYGDVSNTAPQGYMKNYPTRTIRVKGANQTGSSLIVDNFPTSENGNKPFLAGDMIHFQNGDGYRELKMIAADATSDANGEATLTVKPNIRVSPADNAVVTHQSTTCIMRLTSDTEASWNVAPPLLSSLTINFVEAVV